MMQSDTYPELESLASADVLLCNKYAGHVYGYKNQPIVIYTCFGEVCRFHELEELLAKFKAGGSFTIVITHRKYPQSFEQKFNCKIINVKHAYAYYSQQIVNSLIIPNKTPIKTFLSLNNRAQWNRQALMQFLIKFNLLDHFYFSYHCRDAFGVGQKTVYDRTNDIIGQTWYNSNLDLEKLYQLIPITLENDQFVNHNRWSSTEQDSFYQNYWSAGQEYFYQNSFASFVTETYIDENGNAFLSEKIMKPLAYGHPFLVFSSSGALSILQDIGFKTFGDVFDESYDLIDHPHERFENLLREVIRICQFDVHTLENIKNHLVPVIQHNRLHFWDTLPKLYQTEMHTIVDQVGRLINSLNNCS